MDPRLFWKNLLSKSVEEKATDIHFSAKVVYLRLNRELSPYSDIPNIEDYKSILTLFMSEDHKKEQEEAGEVDFAASFEGHRLRCNVYKTINGLCGSFRPLPVKSFPWEQMRISRELLKTVTGTKQGLILVTGPTGSGKSTTICSLLDYMNATYRSKILTIEDPIEYIFENKKAVVDQREVGAHTKGFNAALRAGMRQNPDIIFVGEIRDYITALTALQAAETGHLVFATMHTKRVANTVSRITEMAPPEARGEIRSIIANNVVAVICQRLLPKRNGGILPCREILIMNPAAGNYIREGKEKSLPSVMSAHRTEGMIDWDTALEKLLAEGEITKADYEANQDKADKIKL